jgi:signal transduction histidine kinase
VQLLADLSKDLAYGIGALHARAAVHAERARFEATVMQAPVAVAVYAGPDHVVRLANRRWFALGRGLDCIGKPIREVLPEAARAGALKGLDEVYAKGEPMEVTEFPIPVRRPDGSSETRFINVASQPLVCAGGVVSEIIVAISDVTAQVNARHAVEEARAAAEQASRAKDEFLRMISHELRTPLVPVLALAETLKKDGARDPATISRCLDIILSNARAEARLVDDLIDVSQFVAGAVHLEVDPVDLGTIVQACVDELRLAAAAKPVHLEVRIPPDTVVWGDAGRLSQMVRHLLSNALKFTPYGGTITVEIVRERAALLLCVHDTGAGIPPDQLRSVFEPFQTSDASVKRAYGGLGLGLYLARRIAEAHGGTVWAESDGPGRGATLVAELSAPPRAHPEPEEAAAPPPAHHRA